jgi:hypothetical protein
MTTFFNNIFSINGVIDTGRPVLQNMHDIAAASGCWLTYDITAGKWSVIINQVGSSVASFNDSNIIGGINVSSTGLTEVYNTVEIEFPHKDLVDKKDYIKFSIPAGDRYPNEPDNVLTINSELINDPIQAELIAARELKQSRIDKVIEFRTDFSKVGLRAGDLISVTNSVYGFSSKVFRIISLQDEDTDDGNIVISITALEYDAGVYSTAGLVRSVRERNNNIRNKNNNPFLAALDQSGLAKQLGNVGVPIYNFAVLGVTAASVQTTYNNYAGTPVPSGGNLIPSGFAGNTALFVSVPFSIPEGATVLDITCLSPLSTFDYKTIQLNPGTSGAQTASTVDFVCDTVTGLTAYAPSEYRLYKQNPDMSLVLLDQTTSDWQTQNIKFYLENVQPGTDYIITINPLFTYDFNNHYIPYIFPYNHAINAQSTGYGFSVFVNIFKTTIEE